MTNPLLEILLVIIAAIMSIPIYGIIGLTVGTTLLSLKNLSDDGILSPKKIVKNYYEVLEVPPMWLFWPLTLILGIPILLYLVLLDKPIRKWYSNNKDKPLIMTKSGRTKHVLFGKAE